MKTCTYISGPPCSGKSTVVGEIVKFFPEVSVISGDKFWPRNKSEPFSERVKKVNNEISESLLNNTDIHALIEWVPHRGKFIERIKEISDSKNRRFLHVILTAPVDVLKERKFGRDGDDDLGPVSLPISESSVEKNVLVFDTHEFEPRKIADEIIKQINSNKNAGEEF